MRFELVQADAAVVERAVIEHLVVGLVAIQGDVLDGDVGDVGALKQREIRGDLRIATEVEPLVQAAVEFEAIAGRGDQRPLDDVGALAVRVLADQPDAVADLKPLGVGQGDLLVPMIAVDDELGGGRRFLDQHRVGAAPQEANFRLQKDRVAHPVRARQNTHGAASQPRDVIDGGLDHSIRSADEIRFLRADRDRQALVPVRLDRVAEDRPGARVLGKFVRPQESRAKRAGDQTARGSQELPARNV